MSVTDVVYKDGGVEYRIGYVRISSVLRSHPWWCVDAETELRYAINSQFGLPGQYAGWLP